MPEVTELPSPKGLPMATTSCPTLSLVESPKATVGRVPPASILTTAMSVAVSAPSTLPSRLRPSASVTFTESAPSTTWAFVTIWPSVEMMKPVPTPWTWPSPPCGAPGMGIGAGMPKRRMNSSKGKPWGMVSGVIAGWSMVLVTSM